jgi:CubicO group peptidase (beta-lactamase class C family)
MRRREFIRLLGGAATAWPLAAVARQEASAGLAHAGNRVDEVATRQMRSHQIPGLAVAVVHNGKIVKVQGYGYANLELQKPATRQTVFQLASVTKQFVASGVMILVEDGKLATDAPIRRYLENLPGTWNRVTIRHLLTHTSGIENYLRFPAAATADPERDPQLHGLIRRLQLQFEPGDEWEYSNSNYLLLGQIIERVSGKSYDQFLVERIFGPLGMAATRRRVVGDPAMALGYTLAKDGSAPRAARFLPPALWDNADGGLVSTVEDMAKWDLALSAGTVLSDASIDEMYARTRLNNGKVKDYGYGMRVNVLGSRRIVGHGGTRPGVAANFTRWLDDEITVVVLGNARIGGNEPYQIAKSIAKLYVPTLP